MNPLGADDDGAFNFETTERPFLSVGGNPRLRYFYYALAKFDDFERDENQMAVVKPLATKEESVVICRRWMKTRGAQNTQHGAGLFMPL